MSFAFPAFLYALGLLSIPIAIHLFNFRRFKTIRFSNVKLLQQVQEETQSTARLKHWLILLARLLFLTALVLAFAGPFLPPINGVTEENKELVFFIDNSPSSQANTESNSVFEEHRKKALATLNALPENTGIRVYSADAQPGENRVLSKKEAKEKIEFLTIAYQDKPLSAVLEKVKNTIDEQTQLFVFSDFQKTFVPSELESQSSTQNWIPSFALSEQNISVDTVFFTSPTHLAENVETLIAKVHNHGTEDLDNISVELELDGKIISVVNAELPAETATEVTFTYTNKSKGIQHGKIKVTDNPVSFDNVYYFSYTVADKVNVFELKSSSEKTAIERLFSGAEEYNFTSYTKQTVDYGSIQQTGCLIINGLTEVSSGLQNIIQDKIEAGNSVLFIPNVENGNLDNYNQLLLKYNCGQFLPADTAKLRVTQVANNLSFFSKIFDRIPNNIDLPNVSLHFPITQTSSATQLFSFGNQQPFLLKAAESVGNFFVLTTSLSPAASNWANHALFVPTTLRIAELSGYKQEIATSANNPTPINLSTKITENITLKNTKTEASFLPTYRKQASGTQVFLNQLPLTSGNYDFLVNKERISGIGVNHNRSESSLKHLSSEELSKLAETYANIHIFEGNTLSLSKQIGESYTGKKLWYWFVCLAVLFLIVETVLTRWIK